MNQPSDRHERGEAMFKQVFGRAPRPYLNFGFEPCIGVPDTVSESLGPVWPAPHWIEGGETKRWQLVWRGAKADDKAKVDRPGSGLPERFG